jgi:hypothetical protein
MKSNLFELLQISKSLNPIKIAQIKSKGKWKMVVCIWTKS